MHGCEVSEAEEDVGYAKRRYIYTAALRIENVRYRMV